MGQNVVRIKMESCKSTLTKKIKLEGYKVRVTNVLSEMNKALKSVLVSTFQPKGPIPGSGSLTSGESESTGGLFHFLTTGQEVNIDAF